jgi:hypothetical protein
LTVARFGQLKLGDHKGRHRDKVRQLLANPYGVDGYVITVRFATAEALLSFHRFTERVP